MSKESRADNLVVRSTPGAHNSALALLERPVVLERKQFGVNKELLVTMESKGRVLASGRLKILGEGEKFTGKVNFTEDEASGKKGDD